MFQEKPHAQELGVWDILFEEDTQGNMTHGFLMNELSYILIKMHLSLAGKDIESVNYEWETLATIKKLEDLTKTDIIELLNASADKKAALSKYLTECDENLKKWENISMYLKQEMQLLKTDMQSCLTDKDTSDKAYFGAIDTYDQDLMEKSLNDSITYEKCATENRIQYNAKTEVARKLVFYLWLLQKKYEILYNKQEILAENFKIFRDNILPDLNEIDSLLTQYSF